TIAFVGSELSTDCFEREFCRSIRSTDRFDELNGGTRARTACLDPMMAGHRRTHCPAAIVERKARCTAEPHPRRFALVPADSGFVVGSLGECGIDRRRP